MMGYCHIHGVYYNGMSCPHCQPYQQQLVPNYYNPIPVGCICPPGANKECENPSCPRKNPLKHD